MNYAKQYPEYDSEMRALGWITHDEVKEHRDENGCDWWWHYNDDGLPVPVHLAKDSSGEVFATRNQLGWGRHLMLTELEGWWKQLEFPETIPPPFSVDWL